MSAVLSLAASTTPAPAAAAELLRVDGLSLAFGGVEALAGVGFSVYDGEIVSIIGPNGAGKSSLLNAINGLYSATAGKIFFEGRRVDPLRPEQAARLGVARTFQNLALFKGMSVRDNVLAGRSLKFRHGFVGHALRTRGARREEAAQHAAVAELLDFLDIAEQADIPVGQLPYGLQKRVELARALAAEPRLLLLDEPMAGMTTADKHELARLIVEVNRRLGTTVLLIEHDMGVVMDISDRVVVLDHGRKIADARPDDVRVDPRVTQAYLGPQD